MWTHCVSIFYLIFKVTRRTHTVNCWIQHKTVQMSNSLANEKVSILRKIHVCRFIIICGVAEMHHSLFLHKMRVLYHFSWFHAIKKREKNTRSCFICKSFWNLHQFKLVFWKINGIFLHTIGVLWADRAARLN